jgi:hypothetical protein
MTALMPQRHNRIDVLLKTHVARLVTLTPYAHSTILWLFFARGGTVAVAAAIAAFPASHIQQTNFPC